jgi:hypothetical protein
MSYWLELGVGFIAAVSVIVVAYEAFRILAEARRSVPEATDLQSTSC